MNLEDIMLNEISHSQTYKYYMNLLIGGNLSSSVHRDRKYNSSRQWQGKRRIGIYCLTGMEFQFGKLKKFWRWIVVIVSEYCEYT